MRTKTMTKKELATKLAKKMKAVNPMVNEVTEEG